MPALQGCGGDAAGGCGHGESLRGWAVLGAVSPVSSGVGLPCPAPPPAACPTPAGPVSPGSRVELERVPWELGADCEGCSQTLPEGSTRRRGVEQAPAPSARHLWVTLTGPFAAIPPGSAFCPPFPGRQRSSAAPAEVHARVSPWGLVTSVLTLPLSRRSEASLGPPGAFRVELERSPRRSHCPSEVSPGRPHREGPPSPPSAWTPAAPGDAGEGSVSARFWRGSRNAHRHTPRSRGSPGNPAVWPARSARLRRQQRCSSAATMWKYN